MPKKRLPKKTSSSKVRNYRSQVRPEKSKSRHRELKQKSAQIGTADQSSEFNHEEYLCMNEELQAANEELEASQAELLATNEKMNELNHQLQDKIHELETSQEEVRHFASFPHLNPNPVLELDNDGHLIFCNQAGQTILQQLCLSDCSAFFPTDLDGILQQAKAGLKLSLQRDIAIGNIIFSENIHIIPQFHTIRIYAVEVTESRRSQSALRQSEERFRSVLDNSQDAIYRVNLQTGKYEYASPSCALVLDIFSEELLGASSANLLPQRIHPEDLEAVSAWMGSLNEAGGGQFEYRWQKKNGEYCWLSNHVAIVKDPNGGPLYRDGVVRDVTRFKRIEETLRQTSDYLESLFNYANAPIICWDADFKITRFNHAFEHLTGYQAEEVLGKNLGMLFPKDSQGEAYAKINRALSGERWQVVEIPILHQNGDIRIALWNSANVYANDGNTLLATIAQGQDITERKKKEAELGKLNRILKAMHNSSQAMVRAQEEKAYLSEVCKIIIEDCGYAMVWIGYALDDPGKSVRPMAHAGFEKGYLETLKINWADTERGRGPTGTCIRTGKITFSKNMQIDPNFSPWRSEAIKSGYASSVALPIMGDHQVLGAISIYSTEPDPFSEAEVQLLSELANDLSNGIMAMRLRLSRAKAEADLRKADQRKDQFLAMLAHELRNPLSPIRTSLELIRRREGLNPEMEKFIGTIGRQVDHLTAIVDDLMDTSRISRGLIALHRQQVRLDQAVSQAVEINQAQIDAKRQNLEVSLPEEPLYLEADQTRLVQILANLLNNAAKYTPEQGRISLSARREGAQAIIEVKDTGQGMAADILPHVFDLFYQADTSLDRTRGGLGLGLTLALQLAKMHSGTISARSDGPDQGSTFSLFLPLSTAPAAALPPAGSKSTAPAPAAGLKVLIVEDNQDSAESLAEIVRDWGHQTCMAFTGPAAIEQAGVFEPQVVLLDIGLPVMDGYKVAKKLRAGLLPRATLIGLTGYNPDDRLVKEAGFNHYFTKPVKLEKLEHLLQRLAAEKSH